MTAERRIDLLHRSVMDREMFHYGGMAFMVTDVIHRRYDCGFPDRSMMEIRAVAVVTGPTTFEHLHDVTMPPPSAPLRRWAHIRPGKPWSLS